jgi:hypothetical protein
MGRKTLVASIPVLVLAACSSAPQKQAAFASARTIELRDGTDPVTGAPPFSLFLVNI